jgi:hypothetical protein
MNPRIAQASSRAAKPTTASMLLLTAIRSSVAWPHPIAASISSPKLVFLTTYSFTQIAKMQDFISAKAPAPATAPAAVVPTWSVGPMDISGFIDGYYSYNANRPSDAANGQTNDLYNFNDKTDQFSLNAAKLTLSHDADPIGARVDLFFGRADTVVNGVSSADNEGKYIEQAFLSVKPPKTKCFELDFGKFVTSAGVKSLSLKTTETTRVRCYSPWPFHTSTLALVPPCRSRRQR